MFGNEAYGCAKVEALRATSWAAGTNNGPYIPVSAYEGNLVFVYNVGAVTGSVIYKLQDATDSGGTGVADLSPSVTTASLSTAGGTDALIVDKRKIRSHVRLVATVTTGPILSGVVMLARNKQA